MMKNIWGKEYYRLSIGAWFLWLRDQGIFFALLDPFFYEQDVLLLESWFVPHLETYAVFFVTSSEARLSGEKTLAFYSWSALFEKFLAASKAKIGY